MKETPKRDCVLHRWGDIPDEPLKELLTRKFITSDRMTIAQLVLKKGCTVPKHSHENEQISYVVNGALQFDIDGEEIIVREGEILVIPPNAVHGAVALEDTLDLDVFSPPRQDWLNQTDYYLRGK